MRFSTPESQIHISIETAVPWKIGNQLINLKNSGVSVSAKVKSSLESRDILYMWMCYGPTTNTIACKWRKCSNFPIRSIIIHYSFYWLCCLPFLLSFTHSTLLKFVVEYRFSINLNIVYYYYYYIMLLCSSLMSK